MQDFLFFFLTAFRGLYENTFLQRADPSTYSLANSFPSTWLIVLKHRKLLCELICSLAINTHLP